MIPKPLDQIEEVDLQALVDEGVREGLRLEYKREVRLDGDGKRTLRRAVCAFANTQGGDVLIGVDVDPDDKALPVSLPGVAVSSVDAEELRLSQAARLGLEPQLDGVDVRGVPLQSGEHVFIIRVRQSWRRPHRVLQERHFYARTHEGIYPLEVPQIRRAFLMSERQAEGIRGFVAERLVAIGAGQDLPVRLEGRGRVVLHLIPSGALEPGSEMISTEQLQEEARSHRLRTLIGTGNARFTLEGLAVWNPGGHEEHQLSVATLHRNGIVEAVDASLLEPQHDSPIVPTGSLTQGLEAALESYLAIFRAADAIAPPGYLFLSLLGVRNHRMAVPAAQFRGHSGPFGRDIVTPPEAVIQGWDETPRAILAPVLDRIWNAVGEQGAPRGRRI